MDIDHELSDGAARVLAYIYGCHQTGRRPGMPREIAAAMDPPMDIKQLAGIIVELHDAGLITPDEDQS